MKKINKEFLTHYYETFSFVATKEMRDRNDILNCKYNQWSFFDVFKSSSSLKQIITCIRKLSNQKNKKIIYIMDKEVFFYFSDFRKESHDLFTNDIKEALSLLNLSLELNKNFISCIVYIGSNKNFPFKMMNQISVPIFFISSNSGKGYDMGHHAGLQFNSALTFLKVLLKKGTRSSKKFTSINKKKYVKKRAI